MQVSHAAKKKYNYKDVPSAERSVRTGVKRCLHRCALAAVPVPGARWPGARPRGELSARALSLTRARGGRRREASPLPYVRCALSVARYALSRYNTKNQ